MAENKLPFPEGAFIHKPPMFSGVNYQFWKVRMKIFIEFIDCGIWNAIFIVFGCNSNPSRALILTKNI